MTESKTQVLIGEQQRQQEKQKQQQQQQQQKQSQPRAIPPKADEKKKQ